MTTLVRLLIYGCFVFGFSACSIDEKADSVQTTVPWVKTVLASADDQSALELSGVVRARYETPVAFQLSGRIAARHVHAGQPVKKDQLLFELDTRDLLQTIQTAEAERAASVAALATATADVDRDQKLLARNFVSKQALDRSKLIEQEARARLNAARAREKQAQHALGYARLRAEASGVLVEVSGEPGQVISFGQAIAVLAHDGEREVEVFFPETALPRESGSANLPDGNVLPLLLREAAGAANPASRTWRARYRIKQDHQDLLLGRVIKTHFMKNSGADSTLKIPLGALDERGEGARIWQLREGKAQPVSVQVIALDNEHAWIRADLAENNLIIALGVNLLKSGMAVQALTQ
ncbi:MAG: efflux RND transporter periplasmic adaptor subunit [Nitrosomonas sp.]|nr:efflux RND transporter periplasmic adaptor subunit [Nitrosomonas sp.]